MWRYNFTTDVGPFAKFPKPERRYAMPGEGGIIACTWPRGGSEVLAAWKPTICGLQQRMPEWLRIRGNVPDDVAWYASTIHSHMFGLCTMIGIMALNVIPGAKLNGAYITLVPWPAMDTLSRSVVLEYHGPKGRIAFAHPKSRQNTFRIRFHSSRRLGDF